MRDGVTMQRRLTLDGRKPRISPDFWGRIAGLVESTSYQFTKWHKNMLLDERVNQLLYSTNSHAFIYAEVSFKIMYQPIRVEGKL